MAERRGQVAVKDLPPKLQKKLRRQKIMPKKARKLNRSMAGNALLFTLMFICGVFIGTAAGHDYQQRPEAAG